MAEEDRRKYLHIAFITPRMTIGGAESYTIAKTRYLKEHGCEVLVISSGGENVPNLPKGVSHHTLEAIDSAPYELSGCERQLLVKTIEGILKDNKVDVVELHNTYPVYYGALAAKSAGISCLYNLLNELSHKGQRITNLLIEDFSNGGAYFTLTCDMNRYVEREIGRKLNPVILPIPVELPSRIHNGHADKYILTVCRFSPDKMYVRWLIEGFAEAVTTGLLPREIRLKVVGDGAMRAEVEDCAERANKMLGHTAVELLGYRYGEELEALYDGCLLYAGMGTTMLQAALRGKTILCVGLEEPWSRLAWGYWGECPAKDAHALVEQRSDRNEDTDGKKGISYAKALSVVTDSERLCELGQKAKVLFEAHYEYGKIMEEWMLQYQKTAIRKFVISDRIEKQIEFRTSFLRPLWQGYRLIKKLR